MAAQPAGNISSAEILLPSRDMAADIAFWTSAELGFRMDQIYPADDPRVAALSGHGLRLRLDNSAAADATSPSASAVIRLLCADPETAVGGKRALTSPSGTRVEVVDAVVRMPKQPPTQHAFHVRRLKDNTPWVIGRAGMHYRDLIPGRLGGAIIASHIHIPTAGPVPDSVHFHDVGFQLIFCTHGWVRLVYEDQGPPFVLAAGDCVTQPPRIRHRVLEASAGLRVVEIGAPAEHLTTLDHALVLPTSAAGARPDRKWDGQRFVLSRAPHGEEGGGGGGGVCWRPWRVPGFEARDTGVGEGSGGVAAVRVVRPAGGGRGDGVVTSHTADILFTFVLAGTCVLRGEGGARDELEEGDAFVIPPGRKSSIADCSRDLSLLEVSLPAAFATTVHRDVKLA